MSHHFFLSTHTHTHVKTIVYKINVHTLYKHTSAQNISTQSNNISWCYNVICNSYILRIEMYQLHHCNAKLWAMDI